MTIYSIRTSLGRELWWTTNRKRALFIAEQLQEVGYRIVPQTNGDVGHSDTDGLKAHELPVSVYKSSVVQVRVEARVVDMQTVEG